MAINLRENKMDEFEGRKKKWFFGGAKKTKKIKPAVQSKKIAGSEQKKKIQQSQKTQPKKIQQPKQPKKLQSIQQPKKLQRSKNEKWTRKKPKDPLPKEKLDYQKKVEYEREFSQYLHENPENVLVHWRGPDFEHYPRSKNWYVGASSIVALIVLYAVWTNSMIMAIVFALIWLVGYLQLSRPPKVIDFAVTYDGILVGDDIYDFDEIKSFWIFYEPPHTRVISLHMKGYLRPYLHIPLHQVDPVIVHEKLVEFISEEKQEQNIVDILERLIHM